MKGNITMRKSAEKLARSLCLVVGVDSDEMVVDARFHPFAPDALVPNVSFFRGEQARQVAAWTLFMEHAEFLLSRVLRKKRNS